MQDGVTMNPNVSSLSRFVGDCLRRASLQSCYAPSKFSLKFGMIMSECIFFSAWRRFRCL